MGPGTQEQGLWTTSWVTFHVTTGSALSSLHQREHYYLKITADALHPVDAAPWSYKTCPPRGNCSGLGQSSRIMKGLVKKLTDDRRMRRTGLPAAWKHYGHKRSLRWHPSERSRLPPFSVNQTIFLNKINQRYIVGDYKATSIVTPILC